MKTSNWGSASLPTPGIASGEDAAAGRTRRGEGGTRLIKPADVPTVRVAVADCRRLERLVDRWIDLATERPDLTLQRRGALGPGAAMINARERGTLEVRKAGPSLLRGYPDGPPST